MMHPNDIPDNGRLDWR